MKRLRIAVAMLTLVAVTSCLAGAEVTGRDEKETGVAPDSILNRMKRVADRQLANMQDPSKRYRRKKWSTSWIYATFYTGLAALDQLTAESTYHDALREMANTNDWQPGRRKLHADDHCVSQTYLYLYERHENIRMLEPTRKTFDYVLNAYQRGEANRQESGGMVWSWCDALFMAPPAFVHLSHILGEPKYRQFVHRQWWRTSDKLYDKEAHLYYRDGSYIGKRGPDGNRIFWSRGNGWVLGGLVRVLRYLPKDDPEYGRYVTQFKEMAHALVDLQTDNGLWASSLLNPDRYQSDSSGSAFYVYGFAWGVNQGLLDPETFLSPIRKGWQGLTACIDKDGKFTHVQPIGAAPAKFDPQFSELYGVGALLLAGSEVYRMAGGAAPSFSTPAEHGRNETSSE